MAYRLVRVRRLGEHGVEVLNPTDCPFYGEVHCLSADASTACGSLVKESDDLDSQGLGTIGCAEWVGLRETDNVQS